MPDKTVRSRDSHIPQLEEPGISRFTGHYSWLSNFHKSPIEVDGDRYLTVEHAFQAYKTLDLIERELVRNAPTPAKAKQLGQRVTLRPRWDDMKLAVMERMLREKFARGTPLAAELVATGNRYLTEGNGWGDEFWGVYNGRGLNHLGRLLMKIREDLRK